MSKKNSLISDQLLPAFIKSVEAAFETMAFLPVQVGVPVCNEGDPPEGFFSGSIGITGNVEVSGVEICGNVALIFPDGMAEKVFRSMMMMEETDVVDTDEVKDAVGELANMSAGGAKGTLQDEGIHFMISLPSVVIGVDHVLSSTGNVTSYTVPIDTDKGPFFLEVSFS